MRKGNGSIWSFVDLAFLLCVAFLLSSQVEEKVSNDTEIISPKIFLFIEEISGGEYKVKCNGRYVNNHELQEIIKSSVKEKVDHVEVAARVEEQIPHGYVIGVKNIVKSAGMVDVNGKRVLKVQWDDGSLVSFASE